MSACYCENRDCTCTPEVVTAIENLTPGIKTPLTYHDAEGMVDTALSFGDDFPGSVILRDRLVKALMAVDVASRQQAAQEYRELLGDALDLLVRVAELVDGQAAKDLEARLTSRAAR